MTSVTFYISEKLPALDNMLVDSYLAFGVTGSFIRIYDWQKHTISIGHINTTDNLNYDEINNNDIDLVRRETGGGYINHYNDLCFSFINSSSLSPIENYQYIKEFICAFLNKLGVVADLSLRSPKEHNIYCFNGFNDHEIRLERKKIVGIAQKIKNRRYLVHGSISLKRPTVTYSKYYKYIQIDMDRISFLEEEIKVNKKLLVSSFKEFIEKTFEPNIRDIKELLEDFRYLNYKEQQKSRFIIQTF